MTLRPFHYAFVVDDLDAARTFYRDVIGCGEGRSSDSWIDFDMFGHQIVAHLGDTGDPIANPVDGHDVPVPHFGVVLTLEDFRALAERLVGAGLAFVIPPTVRFAGKAGEQHTMFLRDPAGNALEFKAFADDAALFAVD
ncbi:glyoxalase [Sphingorhabdus soli]|uniref:Glyoxalase n=1 Tax=Flavisphingopyxis soli TaxID=2601267 RepID=A0A5C6U7T5_9SPHN|nr:VOC family protein [Sphingorhabdus soli]TXC68161.1 glyoxalase [Sphingorhabdus soli]